ncbi:hypothetical protein FHS96_005000 [Sphingomonas zeicaulis]|uniref:hypothetical protein n=1 Tax=Sphingomonas zeicaulis TaxID=1632740 RepID=UPI003D224FA6
MKCPPSSTALFIAMIASTLTACSSSIALPTPRIPIDRALLVTPAELPAMPRTVDPATGKAKISGGQCLVGATGLYDVAGQIRNDFIALQEQVRASEGETGKPK